MLHNSLSKHNLRTILYHTYYTKLQLHFYQVVEFSCVVAKSFLSILFHITLLQKHTKTQTYSFQPNFQFLLCKRICNRYFSYLTNIDNLQNSPSPRHNKTILCRRFQFLSNIEMKLIHVKHELKTYNLKLEFEKMFWFYITV